MNTNLIALTGRMRAGKDTLAQFFIDNGYQRMAFADRLKSVTATLSGEPVQWYHDPVKKEEYSNILGMTRREALQLMGTEGVRKIFGPDYWAKTLMAEWEAGGCKPTVITDCRFNNEAQMVANYGGFVIEVQRLAAAASGVVGHASEAGVDPRLVDHVIENNGTVDELHQRAAVWLVRQLEPHGD